MKQIESENTKKRSSANRFLLGSFLGLIALTLAVFFGLSAYLDHFSSQTISQMGEVYMHSLSEQIAMHFQTTISLRLDQVQTMVDDIHPTFERGDMTRDQVLKELTVYSQARGFQQLGLLSYDGEFEILDGGTIHITDKDSFIRSLKNNETKAAMGTDANGNNIVLLGVPSDYLLSNGDPCLALVAAIPTSYITESLTLEPDSTRVYSFIIRKDGTFVIRSSDAFRHSYFDRVHALYEDVDGKTPDEYIEEFSAAMQAGEDYSTEFTLFGEKRRLFATKLARSEWYLLIFLPYGTINQSIDLLSDRLLAGGIVCCAVLFLALVSIFLGYYRINHRQLMEVEEAREAAENALSLAVEARKEAETARNNAERATRAKSEFLSNMSHDIRTPMNAIVGMTAIATANIGNDQQVQNCLQKITTSSRHLLGLINDVLDMSKIESGKMTLSYDRVSLREMMESIVSIVQPQVKSKKQDFRVSILDITTENVLTDCVRLNQVLLNLLSNAVKFTPEGGMIQVTMTQSESAKGGDFVQVQIWVKDNGIGMSEEFKKHIFDSFAREDRARVHKTEGTGLGMAITKYIIDAMGGTLELQSTQGEGTEFHVTLDMEKAETSDVDMVLPPWNMLVVDDSRTLCESTVKVLNSIGVNAEWTLSGEDAIRKVEERHSKHQDYQIILLDWKLPGMDGISTARELRKRLDAEEVPILLISAYDWSEIEADAREAGVSGFISKPLFKSTLFYGLRQYVQDQELPGVDRTQDEVRERFDFTGMRVLVAEDNELNWEIASELLAEYGLELDWAENGQLCVDMLKEKEPGHYQAILMDIRMPVMTGIEATKAIRALDHPDRNIPIVAMTADAFSEDVQDCMKAGMNAHVAKPIDVREVCRLLEKFIDR